MKGTSHDQYYLDEIRDLPFYICTLDTSLDLKFLFVIDVCRCISLVWYFEIKNTWFIARVKIKRCLEFPEIRKDGCCGETHREHCLTCLHTCGQRSAPGSRQDTFVKICGSWKWRRKSKVSFLDPFHVCPSILSSSPGCFGESSGFSSS